jgi:hypothetical protein
MEGRRDPAFPAAAPLTALVAEQNSSCRTGQATSRKSACICTGHDKRLVVWTSLDQTEPLATWQLQPSKPAPWMLTRGEGLMVWWRWSAVGCLPMLHVEKTSPSGLVDRGSGNTAPTNQDPAVTPSSEMPVSV